MQLLSIVIMFLAVSVMSSCSNQQVYEGIKQNRKNSCERLQGTQKEECLQLYDKPYEPYKRHRRQFDSEYFESIA